MDPYYETCTYKVFPLESPKTVATNNSASDDDQFFNITVTCKNWNWRIPSMDYDFHTASHVYSNISKEVIEELAFHIVFLDFFVPEDASRSMVVKILDCARNMADNTHKNHKVLNMGVYFETLVWNFTNEGDDDGAMEDQGNVLVPASESFIEGLETVRVEEEDDCSICLEYYKDDAEGVRLPCLHLFHKICIISWVHKGNVCPLCRFKMPISDNS